MFQSYKHYLLDESTYFGFIEGFISDNDSDFIDILNKYDYSMLDVHNIEIYKSCKKAYISIIYINEEFRGNKIGTKLFEKFLIDAFSNYDVEYIFLISYNLEPNNFILQDWYKSYGFQSIANKNNCPLMVLKENIIN